MALIKCPECKKKVSDLCDNCPHCGYPIKAISEATIDGGAQREVIIIQKTKSPSLKRMWYWAAIVAIVTVVVVAAIAVVPLLNGEEQQELSGEGIFNSIAPSTVEIHGLTLDGFVIGTGFFIDNQGTVITNYHVIEDCLDADIVLQDGTDHSVMSVLGYDENLDIAILSTTCMRSVPVTYREEAVLTGEKVYTLGSSLGLTGTFAEGIISTANRKVNGKNFIQTTAPISSGNSGGPLVDKDGQVIGVTTAAFEEGQNLNLAVPIVLALNIKRDSHLGSLQKLFLKQYSSSGLVEMDLKSYIENPNAETRANLINMLENYKKTIKVWVERPGFICHSHSNCPNIKDSVQMSELTVGSFKTYIGYVFTQCSTCW